MLCANCGNKLNEESKFCDECGALMEVSQATCSLPDNPRKLTIIIGLSLIAVLIGGGLAIFMLAGGYNDAYPVVAVVDEAGQDSGDDIATDGSITITFDAEAITSDFLWQFPSIFQMWQMAEMRDWLDFAHELGGSVSGTILGLWSFDNNERILFDLMTGNRVTEAHNIPCLHGLESSAQHFSLYHLSDGDVPVVVVGFLPMFANGPVFIGEVYVFESGMHRLLGAYVNPRFLIDANDRKMLTYLDWGRGQENTLYYINYVNGVYRLEPVVAEGIRWVYEDEFDENWGINAAAWIDGRRLMEIPRLEAMGERIYQELRHKFETEIRFVDVEVITRQVRELEAAGVLSRPAPAATLAPTPAPCG